MADNQKVRKPQGQDSTPPPFEEMWEVEENAAPAQATQQPVDDRALIATETAEIEDTSSEIDLASRRYDSNPTFERNEVNVPRLKLGQPITKEVVDGNATAGQWILPGYPSQDEIVVVPLAMSRARELRDGEQKLLCSSPDAKIGKGIPGGECAKCPMAEWTPRPGGGVNLPPQCDFIYSYVVYIPEHQTMALLDFRKTTINIAKFINTVAQGKRFKNFGIRLRSDKTTKGRNSWFSPLASQAPIDEQDLEIARSLLS